MQSKLRHNLEVERLAVDDSLLAMRNDLHKQISLQYSSLPPRYLLLLQDGSSKTAVDPRTKIAKLTLIFVRTKRRQLLGKF